MYILSTYTYQIDQNTANMITISAEPIDPWKRKKKKFQPGTAKQKQNNLI